MTLTDTQLHLLAADLDGTSGAYDSTFIQSLPIDDIEEVADELEQCCNTVRCTNCGWWTSDFQPHEDQQLCHDCYDELESDTR